MKNTGAGIPKRGKPLKGRAAPRTSPTGAKAPAAPSVKPTGVPAARSTVSARTRGPKAAMKRGVNRALGFAPPPAPKAAPRPPARVNGAQKLGGALGVVPKSTVGRGFRAGTIDGRGVGDAKAKFALHRTLRVGGTTHAVAQAGRQRLNVRIDSGAGNQMVHTRKGAGIQSTGAMKDRLATRAAKARPAVTGPAAPRSNAPEGPRLSPRKP